MAVGTAELDDFVDAHPDIGELDLFIRRPAAPSGAQHCAITGDGRDVYRQAIFAAAWQWFACSHQLGGRRGREPVRATGRGRVVAQRGRAHASPHVRFMALFAANINSYRRLRDSSIQSGPTWGYNNRSVALRIPAGEACNTRIEHRVAAADASPHFSSLSCF